MNERSSETKKQALEERLFVTGKPFASAPDELWDKIDARCGKQQHQRRRRQMSVALALGVVLVGLSRPFWPHEKSLWRLDGQPVAVGQTIAPQRTVTLTAPKLGTVTLEANSRLRVVTSRAQQQRLALEKGSLLARVDAPPRLFVVETPSTVATDLGCAYRLDVVGGKTRLQVQTGWVELADRTPERSVLVPAGAEASVDTKGHVSLPWYPERQAAVAAYTAGGSLAALLSQLTEPRDTLILFHLLPRVTPPERPQVLDKLLESVALPPEWTREQVLRLDPRALVPWREQLQLLW